MPKPLRKMIALRPLTYKTRRLQAGDEFEAPRDLAAVLHKSKKAREARDHANLAPPSPDQSRRLSRRPAEEEPPAPAPVVEDDTTAAPEANAPEAIPAEPVDEPTIEINEAPQDSPTDPEKNAVDGPDNPQPEGVVTELPEAPAEPPAPPRKRTTRRSPPRRRG